MTNKKLLKAVEGRHHDKKPRYSRKQKPSQMERVKAARCYINQAVRSQSHAEDLEFEAFMSIFHPEVPAETVREMRIERRRR